MRKKQPIKNTEPDGTVVHPVGQERFVSVQRYVGDLPSKEPVDWLPQSDEDEPCVFLLGTADTELHENR
jgi:hypothetical protein